MEYCTLIVVARVGRAGKQLLKNIDGEDARYFLTGASCKTFDELFEKVLSYEELERNKASYRTSRASTNAVYDNNDRRKIGRAHV